METVMGPFEKSTIGAISLLEGIALGVTIVELSRAINQGEEIPEMWSTILAFCETNKREIVEC
jgi:hypothetical protein